MRTKRVIGGIVAAVFMLGVAVVVAVVTVLGAAVGIGVSTCVAVLVIVGYRYVLGPWQRRWGTTQAERVASMPGDGIIPDAQATTRAIYIEAPPDRVWPWLLQLGYGRAGWYSYDLIDNDGRPSAERIVPEYQALGPGDQITMVPGMGPHVRVVDPPRTILAGDDVGGTWCMQLREVGSGTRLVSRWRMPRPSSPATRLWMLIADPGAFVMERKMLLGIRHRAEALCAREEHPVTLARTQ